MTGPEVDLSQAVWRKASATSDQNQCVEVADLGRRMAVRDSKDPDGPKLLFSRPQWSHFLNAARRGEFDHR